jgi:magnesium-transporting ATPase (P-type)
MAMYSFTEFTTILILYWLTSNYGDLQYLYIDLLTITTLALCMGRFDISPPCSSPDYP